MTMRLLVALENANKVLSDIQRIFNTGPYGDPPPLKIKILNSASSSSQKVMFYGIAKMYSICSSSCINVQLPYRNGEKGVGNKA